MWHFPVTVQPEATKPVVEKYRVILGDSADAQIEGEDLDQPGRLRKLPNTATVPASAWTQGWKRSRQEIHLPAPVVTMTVEQFATEVFPLGSPSRGQLDALVADGTVRLDESVVDAIDNFETETEISLGSSAAATKTTKKG